MTCVPEKVDLFQLNVEVWCDCGQGAEEQEGLLGAGQGFRAGGCSMGGGGGAQGEGENRGHRSQAGRPAGTTSQSVKPIRSNQLDPLLQEVLLAWWAVSLRISK